MNNYDHDKFIEHLGHKWGKKVCPMCGANRWGVSDKAMELREFNQGNLVVGGSIQPLIPVNCGNCGYTILVNGLIAGVIERGKEESDDNE